MKIIEVPGSKSFTNRALILASLATGVSTIENYSKSNDSLVLINCLERLGVEIVKKEDKLIIKGNQGKFKSFKGVLNVGEAGTVYRFLTGLTAIIPGKITFSGSQRLLSRPIDELKKAVEEVKKGEVLIRGDISSQFISALLMIAPVLPKGLVINITSDLVSRSYIEMTIETMKQFGVEVKEEKKNKKFIVKNQRIKSSAYLVESDASGASYFWAMAAVTGKLIRVVNINPLSKQGDVKFADLLGKMDCWVKKNINKKWIEVKGKTELKGIEVNMNLMPDTAQTLAVVAAFAKGRTKITGLSTLKHKETDRLLALKNELGKMGIKTEITSDSITVFGGEPKPAVIETYNDHRMAMAFAVAKAKIPEIEIKNPWVVKKSFPNFWEKFNQVL